MARIENDVSPDRSEIFSSIVILSTSCLARASWSVTPAAKSAVERVAAASVAAHFLYKFMIIKLFHYKIYSMWADNYFEIARFKYNIAVGIRK